MKMDVAYSVGFIAGAVVTSLLLGQFGVAGLLRLLLVIGGGICGGLLGDWLAKSRRPPQ